MEATRQTTQIEPMTLDWTGVAAAVFQRSEMWLRANIDRLVEHHNFPRPDERMPWLFNRMAVEKWVNQPYESGGVLPQPVTLHWQVGSAVSPAGGGSIGRHWLPFPLYMRDGQSTTLRDLPDSVTSGSRVGPKPTGKLPDLHVVGGQGNR